MRELASYIASVDVEDKISLHIQTVAIHNNGSSLSIKLLISWEDPDQTGCINRLTDPRL